MTPKEAKLLKDGDTVAVWTTERKDERVLLKVYAKVSIGTLQSNFAMLGLDLEIRGYEGADPADVAVVLLEQAEKDKSNAPLNALRVSNVPNVLMIGSQFVEALPSEQLMHEAERNAVPNG